MRQKLGLDPPQDLKVLLQGLREGEEGKMLNKLTDYELKEMTQKSAWNGGPPSGFEMPDVDMRDEVDKVKGIGLERRAKEGGVSAAVHAILRGKEVDPKLVNMLEGAGEDQLKYMDQRSKLAMINYLKEKLEEEHREKKEKKKAKKEKKRLEKEEEVTEGDREGQEEGKGAESVGQQRPEAE